MWTHLQTPCIIPSSQDHKCIFDLVRCLLEGAIKEALPEYLMIQIASKFCFRVLKRCNLHMSSVNSQGQAMSTVSVCQSLCGPGSTEVMYNLWLHRVKGAGVHLN